jgi:hypothetical protein
MVPVAATTPQRVKMASQRSHTSAMASSTKYSRTTSIAGQKTHKQPGLFLRLIAAMTAFAIAMPPLPLIAATWDVQEVANHPFAWPPPKVPLPFQLTGMFAAGDAFPGFTVAPAVSPLLPQDPVQLPWVPGRLDPIAPPDGMPVQGNPAGLALLENAVGNGVIVGEVSDATSLDPVPGALVEIVGSGRTAEADAQGRFQFVGLPAGTFNVEASQLGYFTDATVVTVIEGSPSEVRFGLRARPADESASEFTLEEESVIGEYQGDSAGDFNLSLQMESPTLTSSLSRDDFEKTAVSDAGEAIGKVAGANIVDGKYAVVRGLADRYVSTTFNGGQIASADPSRKAVQLDLFPTGVIEALNVDKTYSPWLPGDFGGGAINIVTRAFPDERILTFKTKFSFNDSDDDEMFIHPGGDYDFLGSVRPSLPSVLETTNANGDVVFRDTGNTAPADLAERWRTLHDSQSFLPAKDDTRIGESYGFTYGESFQVNDLVKLGIITALSQSSGDDNNSSNNSNPAFQSGFLRDDYSRSVDTSAFFSAAVSLAENHTVKATYFDKHIAEDTVARGSGQDDGSNFGLLTSQAVFDIFGGDAVYKRGFWDIGSTARDLRIVQLQGEHQFGDRGPSFDWNITDSKASENRPYSSFFSFGEMDFSPEALAPFTEKANTNLYNSFTSALDSANIPYDPSITTWDDLRPVIVGLTSEDFVRNAEISNGLPRIAPNGVLGGQTLINTVDINTYTGSAEGRLRFQRRSDITSERALDQQAAFKLPFYLDEENDERLFEIRAGASTYSKDRSVRSRVYDLTLRNDSGDGSGFDSGVLTSNGLAEALAANPDLISAYFNGTLQGGPFYSNFLGEGGVENLDTELRQSSWFLNGRFQWDKTFLTGGLRYEKETYEVRFRNPPEVSAALLPVLTNIENDVLSRNPLESYLPALTLGSAAFEDKFSWLVAWSKTTARPTFWEFVPTVSVDQASGIGRRGNAALSNTEIENLDLGLTYAVNDQFTLRTGLFHKKLDRPLVAIFSPANEIIYRDSIESGGITQNFEAEISGVELEAEISKIGPFTFSGNFTYIDALLDYFQEGPVEPIPVSSALPFQPEYIANFTLTHEYEPWDLTTNLVYNFTGEYPSILKREPDDSEVGRQDITTFDLIIAKTMEINEADYTFRIGVKNLLGAEDTYIYNGRTFSSDDLGRTYYFEAEVSF